MRKVSFLVLLLLSLAIFTSVASADTFTYILSTPNSALSSYTGPFGTVLVDRTSSTTANITFTADPGYLFLDSSIADVNVNATSWTLAGLTGTHLAGFSGPSLSNAGSANVDGFGTFNQTIDEFDGFGYALDTVSFTLTDTSGTWSSASGVFTPNSKNYAVAVHLGVCNKTPCVDKRSGGNFLATGYVANGPTPTPVPEPASLLLLGTGVGSLALRLRRSIAR